jgi:hypothetical protein
MSMAGYELREGLVEYMDRGAFRKRCSVRIYSIETPSCRDVPTAVDQGDLRRKTVPLLWLRPSSGMRSVSPPPRGGSNPTWLVGS